MRSLFVISVVFAATGFSAATDGNKEQAIQHDRGIYEGTWRLTLLQADGKTSAEKDIEKIVVVNGRDGTWSIVVDGKEVERGSSTIDPTQKPKTIDFIPALGQDKGKVCLGIYEIQQNSRKLCFAPPGKNRPKEFTAPAGAGLILVTFKREKP